MVDQFINEEGFLVFYIAALITGSLFNIDRNLLLRATVRLLPVAVVSLALGVLLSGVVGIIMGDALTGSLQKQWAMEQRQREQIIQLSHKLKTPLTIIEDVYKRQE